MKRELRWTYPGTCEQERYMPWQIGMEDPRPSVICGRVENRRAFYVAPAWIAWLYRLLPNSLGFCTDRNWVVIKGFYTFWMSAPAWRFGIYAPWGGARKRAMRDVMNDRAFVAYSRSGTPRLVFWR